MTDPATVKLSHALAFSKVAMLRKEFMRQLEAAGVECDRSERGEFILSADEHRRQAALLRRAGNYQLAQHGENLANLIEAHLRMTRR
jgi:hypothetical protein